MTASFSAWSNPAKEHGDSFASRRNNNIAAAMSLTRVVVFTTCTFDDATPRDALQGAARFSDWSDQLSGLCNFGQYRFAPRAVYGPDRIRWFRLSLHHRQCFEGVHSDFVRCTQDIPWCIFVARRAVLMSGIFVHARSTGYVRSAERAYLLQLGRRDTISPHERCPGGCLRPVGAVVLGVPGQAVMGRNRLPLSARRADVVAFVLSNQRGALPLREPPKPSAEIPSVLNSRCNAQHAAVSTVGWVFRPHGVEALPGYAPDLNPWDEGSWHHLKFLEMRNLV